MRKTIDAPQAVTLHREQGWRVPAIAAHFGCQAPAIYRAFRTQGYITGNMVENRKPREHLLLPPAGLGPPTPRPHNGRTSNCDKAIDALPVVMRDPCFRCGARGDYGCKCSKARVGWHAG